jgi:WD40 repeat protein
VTFSPDGKRIASGSGDKTIKLWDATTGDLQKTLAGHSASVSAVAFSPDGKRIISGSWDKTIKLWDATTGDLQKTLAGHSASVSAVAFSPDGKRIISGSWDKTIKLWDATTGDLQKTLAGHSDSVNTVVFSPDGKWIASGSRDTIKLWDTTTGDLQKTLAGHLDLVNAVVFSPDGKRIASGSWDKTIKLWDVNKSLKATRLLGSTLGSRLKFRTWQQEIKTLVEVHTLKFSPDGRYLATNLGPIKVESILADRQSPDFQSLDSLCVSKQWIYYGAAPVLWLPSEFEPKYYDVRGNQVAIGFRNGQVLSFDIDRRSLHSVLELCRRQC